MSARSNTYRLLGLQVRSDIPLSALPAVGDADPDLTIVISTESEGAATQVLPEGRLVAEHVNGNFRLYTAVSTADGHVLRVHTVCDVHLSSGLETMTVFPAPGRSLDAISIVLSGTAISFLLNLRGLYVLHGSSVRMTPQTLAFVNRSGGGKSTLAAQFCAAGAMLITDDVLPLRISRNQVQIVGTSRHIRLREKAWELVGSFDEVPPARETVDRRLAVAPVVNRDEVTRLDRIVIPLPSRTASSISLDRLDPGDAVFSLLLFPRIVHWFDEDVQRRHFEFASQVAACVSVYRAEIPWGPPFPAEAPAQMLDLLDQL